MLAELSIITGLTVLFLGFAASVGNSILLPSFDGGLLLDLGELFISEFTTSVNDEDESFGLSLRFFTGIF
jgi:hypothetical protein